jgi:type I restriction enzyme S subunit
VKLETFFENFEQLAAAPDGVQKLRELILQLAVQGKLVPQDANDEPASALLEKIKIEKARLVKEKKIKKSELLSPIEAEDAPFELPHSWEWSRLSEVGIINPRNQAEDEQEVSFIPMNLIPAAYGASVQSEKRLWKEIKGGFTHFAEGDVALAKITPCFQNGKSAVMRDLINGVGAGTTELHIFRQLAGLMLPDYVLLYLKSSYFIENGIPRMTGSAGQKRVPNDYFSNNPFPLPPLDEQRRIVAKVDQLMALCDELEARQQQQQVARVQVNNAALDRLLTAREPEEFAEHWQRICDNFDLLYDAPETVGQLRQAVLQLAVQGKLVPQDPNDEPASALLEKIRAEKERLVKEKEIKKGEPLPPIEADKAPFELPQRWEWVRMAELGSFLGGGTPSKANPSFWSGDIPWVSPKDMKAPFLLDVPDHISEEALLNSSAQLIPRGSLLMVIRGMILAHSFPVAINLCDVAINQDMKALRFFSPEVSHYLLLTCRGLKKQMLEKVERSSHGTCRIDSQRIEDFLLPLPPLEEQQRILAKVDQLMALCDELEAKLKNAQAASGKLLEATVNHLLMRGKTKGAAA